MCAPYQRIIGHERVSDAFGYWPVFHDAEIRSLVLDRNAIAFDEVADARIDVCLHVFEWARDAKPVFNHHLVEFRFHHVSEVALEGFNHQNAILEFRIEDHVRNPDVPVGFRLTFVGAHSLSGSFSAAGAEIISIVPCDEKGKPLQRSVTPS